MNTHSVLEVILGCTEIEATFFVTRYGLLSRWRATLVGRSMFWLAFSFWLLLTWILLSLFVPEFAGRDYVRTLLFLFFGAMFFRMNVTLVRIQRAERRGQTLEDLSDWHQS